MKPATASTAVQSMTGFAQARVESDGWSLRINLRSVNHRFLDLRLRMPDGFEVFEPRIRQAVRARLRRGHVDITIYYEPTGPAAVALNRQMAEAYWKVVEELRRQFGVKTEPDLIALFRLPGVVAAPDAAGELQQDEEAQERLGARLEACLDQALARLQQMRRSEGQTLAAEMRGLLGRIAGNTAKIEKLAVHLHAAFARRLESKLMELLNGVQIDPSRLAQEAALLAERGDVSEELARLHSHVEQFEQLLSGAGEAGKKLDFLLQEMQREANTLLSKTPGVESEGLAITGLALEIKSDIEKLREQAQNVE
jgi:uncharacterized protein (TIGR00255 family)